MASTADVEMEDSNGLYKAGAEVDPTIFLSVAKEFVQQQRCDPNFKLISYKIGNPTTPGHKGELKCAEILKSQLQNRPDSLVIHSFSNLTPADQDHIEEIDLIVVDKLQGLFIMEVKGVMPIATNVQSKVPIGSTPTKSDAKYPYCPRAVVLLARKQMELRFGQIEDVLLRRDVMKVGKNYGLLTNDDSVPVLLNELLDTVELVDRMRRNSFSIHPEQQGFEYNNLDERCGRDKCYCSNPEADGVRITSETHPHVVGFSNLQEYFALKISDQLAPLASNDILLEHFYLFLIRRFVIIPRMFQLPPASKLLEVTKLMKPQLDKHSNDLRDNLVGVGVQILTSEQQNVLRQSGRLCITGPAGSGKTVILMLKAKQIIDASFQRRDPSPNQLLFVCSTNGITNQVKESLKQHYNETSQKQDTTRQNYADTGVQMPPFEKYALVTTFQQLVDKLKKLFKTRWVADLTGALKMGDWRCRMFTNVFVDESQDLSGQWHQLLELQLATDLTNGQHCFWCCYDTQQTLLDENNGINLLSRIETVKLTKIFRSTKRIHNLLTAFVSMKDVSISHNILGEIVTIYDRLPNICKVVPHHAAPTIIDVINMMTKEDNKVGRAKKDSNNNYQRYKLNDIVVLVDNDFKAMLMIDELNELSKAARVEAVSAKFTHTKLKSNQFRVDSVHNFRGLEAPVVIWTVPNVGWNHQDRYNFGKVCGQFLDIRALFYSAFTRATAHLVLITTKQANEIKEICQMCGERRFTLAKLEEFLQAKLSNKRQSEDSEGQVDVKLVRSEDPI